MSSDEQITVKIKTTEAGWEHIIKLIRTDPDPAWAQFDEQVIKIIENAMRPAPQQPAEPKREYTPRPKQKLERRPYFNEKGEECGFTVRMVDGPWKYAAKIGVEQPKRITLPSIEDQSQQRPNYPRIEIPVFNEAGEHSGNYIRLGNGRWAHGCIIGVKQPPFLPKLADLFHPFDLPQDEKPQGNAKAWPAPVVEREDPSVDLDNEPEYEDATDFVDDDCDDYHLGPDGRYHDTEWFTEEYGNYNHYRWLESNASDHGFPDAESFQRWLDD